MIPAMTDDGCGEQCMIQWGEPVRDRVEERRR